MKTQKYKKIEVVWEDITFYDKSCNLKDKDKPETRKAVTIGYLIREDKKHLIISLTICDDNTFMDFYVFPKGVILSRKYIK